MSGFFQDGLYDELIVDNFAGGGGAIPWIGWRGDLYAVGWAWSSNGGSYSQESASVLVTLAL